MSGWSSKRDYTEPPARGYNDRTLAIAADAADGALLRGCAGRGVARAVLDTITREIDKAREHLRPRNEYDEGPLAMQMAYAGAVVEQLAERVRAMTTKGDES